VQERSFTARDTDPDAYDFRIQAYRDIGGSGRTEAMFRRTEMARKNAVAGIRERHPWYEDGRLQLAFFRLLFGDELAKQVWPDRELPDP
jgi:hypothetical protein